MRVYSVFDGADMYIYDSQDFHTIDTHRMIRELVDYAVISRDFKTWFILVICRRAKQRWVFM